MKPSSIILCWLLLCWGFSSVVSPEPTETYAHVRTTILNADSEEAMLAEQSSLGLERILLVHLDANTECTAFVPQWLRRYV